MSKQWENEIAKQVHRETSDDIRSYRCGFSGSNAMPQPDILLTDRTMNYGLELKGPIKSERCYVEAEDIEQLVACQNTATNVGLVIKFQRREPMVVRYFNKLSGQMDGIVEGDYNDLSPVEKFRVLCPQTFEPRVTEGGSLAVTKPTTDEWPSSRAGADDIDAILSGLGIETAKSTSVEL